MHNISRYEHSWITRAAAQCTHQMERHAGRFEHVTIKHLGGFNSRRSENINLNSAH